MNQKMQQVAVRGTEGEAWAIARPFMESGFGVQVEAFQERDGDMRFYVWRTVESYKVAQ